jgi:hypothetical protein
MERSVVNFESEKPKDLLPEQCRCQQVMKVNNYDTNTKKQAVKQTKRTNIGRAKAKKVRKLQLTLILL